MAPRGMEAEGEGRGVFSGDDLPRIKVVYAEAGFECVPFVLPTADLAASVQLAMEHGVNEASKQLGFPKERLHALASGPLVKPDGSPIPVEEWVNNHFIVVMMKQYKKEEGLLDKYRKQHAFREDVMRQDINDLDVLTSKKAVDDVPNMLEEISLLKEESAYLRAKLFALEKTWKAKHETSKAEIEALKAEVERLKAELATVQEKIAHLSGLDLVMVRMMLEECRTKCRTFLSQRNVHIPDDWNELIHDPICIAVLEGAGLTVGLHATGYGKKSQQKKGSKAAHSITEMPEACATIVCNMHGHLREQMMDVFEFVFERRAEDLAFEDI